MYHIIVKNEKVFIVKWENLYVFFIIFVMDVKSSFLVKML